MENTATYCPEDNKLRLYVGRVPRDEYEALRKEGWTSTPKQACNFVAHWTPQRRDTALEYAGIIGDEDQSPEDRAADRAERFAEYRDKRTSEAVGHADRYDSQPLAHGFQSASRAEASARRHDRIAGRAVDAWSKAEYWTSRTAGVISHALYKDLPGVRMGRIITLETELRLLRKRWEGRTMDEWAQDWCTHYELRLAYENQMIDAQGGRVAAVEMVPGGFIGKYQIQKVNKSSATGLVVSVGVLAPVEAYFGRRGQQYGTNRGGPLCLHVMNVERLTAGAYRAPTPEELATFEAEQVAKKKVESEKRKATAVPLINPTPEEAQRLQTLWNEQARARGEARKITHKYSYNPELTEPFSEVLAITQATYTANSGGTYSRAETLGIGEGGKLLRSYDERKYEKAVCKIRVTSGATYMPHRVIVLTDKPQKALPAAGWPVPAFKLESVTP